MTSTQTFQSLNFLPILESSIITLISLMYIKNIFLPTAVVAIVVVCNRVATTLSLYLSCLRSYQMLVCASTEVMKLSRRVTTTYHILSRTYCILDTGDHGLASQTLIYRGLLLRPGS
jgi:hypothetical protein